MRSVCSDICIFKTQFTWLVFIKNSNSAPGIIAIKSVWIISIWSFGVVIKFNTEFKIWLPVMIIYNFNIKYFCCFLWAHCENFLLRNKEFRRSCSSLDCSDTDGNFLMHYFFHNRNWNFSSWLGYRVRNTFESNLIVLVFYSLSCFNLTFYSLNIYKGFCISYFVLFSGSKSFE